MRSFTILDKYMAVLSSTEGVDQRLVPIYARELYRRHQAGWRMPTSTYKRCEELLFYKDSLGRRSPYYVDLFKIEDEEKLKIVLVDLCHTIHIRYTR